MKYGFSPTSYGSIYPSVAALNQYELNEDGDEIKVGDVIYRRSMIDEVPVDAVNCTVDLAVGISESFMDKVYQVYQVDYGSIPILSDDIRALAKHIEDFLRKTYPGPISIPNSQPQEYVVQEGDLS